MVPLPRASRRSGKTQARPFSRCGGIRVFVTARHESVASRANKMREAERRQAHTHYNRATPPSVTACRRFGRGARHASATLPPQCASGALASRRSVAALARFLGLAQLRAAFVSIWRSLRYSKRLLASSSRPSRSAGEAGSEAARERSVWLRPQGPHSLCLTGAPSRSGIPQERAAPSSSGRADGVKPNHCEAANALTLRCFLDCCCARARSRRPIFGAKSAESTNHDSQGAGIA